MSIKENLKRKLSYRQLRRIRNLIYFLTLIVHQNDLTKLARIFGTDKGTYHGYTNNYIFHFKKFRYRRINLLEIGVGGYDNPTSGGGSLRMWKRYFPFGKIFSIDLFDKSLLQEKRIKIFQGSQIDQSFLIDVFNKISELDIVIDDGSHINAHVISTFKVLFPLLNAGGVYVIEDTQTSYWPDFGGDGINLDNPGTIMNFFKKLTDCPNHKEFKNPKYQLTIFDKSIESIHFYHNMIIIKKTKKWFEDRYS